jgi:hypothetical protein
VKDDAKNPPLVFPANVGELVMIIFGIADNARLNLLGMVIGMSLFF